MNNMKQGQLTKVEYVVKKPFKYKGEMLRRGDRWHPKGGKWDTKIIEQEDLVYRLETAILQEA